MNDVTEAFTAAVTVAGKAPSIHNTQPWRFVVNGPELELHTEPSRQLVELDPDGHMLLASCGAALHHAAVALAAAGYRTRVERTGEAHGLVARLRVVGDNDGDVDPAAVRRLEAVARRHTDRRPVAPVPVPAAALAAVSRAVTGAGLALHVLRPRQVVDLAVAVDRASHAEGTDERQRAELAGWVGGERPSGTGIPDAAIPGSAPETTVAARDFGVDGTLTAAPGQEHSHDERAVFAVIYGPGDRPADWLRAGEALSAAWLDAVAEGLTLTPVSAPAEIASTRLRLGRLVANVGFPYLVVRLGMAHDGEAAATPRLPVTEIVEVR